MNLNAVSIKFYDNISPSSFHFLSLFTFVQKRGRGQHDGNKHGAGQKGSGQRQNYMRLGYETGNTPFYLRFGMEPYYKGHQ